MWRLRRSQCKAGPARPDAISRSSAIRNDESSSAGGTAAFGVGVFGQFGFGPIGEFVRRHNFAEGACMDQLGARHAGGLRSLVELLQFGGGVTRGNGKLFHARSRNERERAVNYGGSFQAEAERETEASRRQPQTPKLTLYSGPDRPPSDRPPFGSASLYSHTRARIDFLSFFTFPDTVGLPPKLLNSNPDNYHRET